MTKSNVKECKNRKSDTIWYKIKDQLIMYIFAIFIGIIGYFLHSFISDTSTNLEKRAQAETALERRVQTVEESTKFFTDSFKEFKFDLNKRLDRIERKIDTK